MQKKRSSFRNGSVRRSYDEKIVGSRKSSERMKRRRARAVIIALWAAVCVIIAIIFYNVFAKKRMSDTPRVAIRQTTGVRTGTDLIEGKDFGPWLYDLPK